jgi:hypothetical protein
MVDKTVLLKDDQRDMRLVFRQSEQTRTTSCRVSCSLPTASLTIQLLLS